METSLLHITVGDLLNLVGRLEGVPVQLDPHRLFGPRIDGIEVTQAIQYYKADQHLTDAADRGADNSVRLVAYKPAWVRIYLRARPGNAEPIPNVTGELLIKRRDPVLLGVWNPVMTRSPIGVGSATATVTQNYATERSALGATLNFTIPWTEMFGFLSLTARIWKAGASRPSDTLETQIDATLLQTLNLRGIMVSYNGPDASGKNTLNLAAPTLANLQNTAAFSLTVDPVQATGIFSSTASALPWSTPLTGTALVPGGCSQQWTDLNAALAKVKTNDGNRTDLVYYGLLPSGIPIANVGGCGLFGVSAGPVGAQGTMAHEIGHVAGLGHGPCGTTSGDPDYPAYEPYETATNKMSSIGEYGLNINSGAILSPATNDDYMWYCNQNWISLYHHAKLLNRKVFNPQTVGVAKFVVPDLVDPFLWPWEYEPDPPPWERDEFNWRRQIAEPLISIIGVVTRQRIDVRSVMRVKALPHARETDYTEFTAELLNREHQPIAAAPLARFDLSGSGCRCCRCRGSGREDDAPYIFHALIPDVADGAALRITRRVASEDEPREVWLRQAPAGKPRIERFEARVREDAGYARWEVEQTSEAELEFALQFSKDHGRSWNSLAVSVTDRELRFDLSAMPSGEVVFALLAHDGFHSVRAESEPVEIPPHPPTISILHPREAFPLSESQPVRLWAAVTTSTGHRIDDRACRWLLDGHPVGEGIEAWIDAPDPGEHRCTLIVEDEAGRAEASVTFPVERLAARESRDHAAS